MNLEQLKYPIGHYTVPTIITSDIVTQWIKDIEDFPALLENEVAGLSKKQLQTRYRPGGWTIHQVVHHCADSHTNSLIRFKWGLTEDKPTIKTYWEDRWAELPDTLDTPIDWSMMILKGLHQKWAYLLRQLSEVQLDRQIIHPDIAEPITLRVFIGHYSWHCRHHLAHIKQAKEQF